MFREFSALRPVEGAVAGGFVQRCRGQRAQACREPRGDPLAPPPFDSGGVPHVPEAGALAPASGTCAMMSALLSPSCPFSPAISPDFFSTGGPTRCGLCQIIPASYTPLLVSLSLAAIRRRRSDRHERTNSVFFLFSLSDGAPRWYMGGRRAAGVEENPKWATQRTHGESSPPPAPPRKERAGQLPRRRKNRKRRKRRPATGPRERRMRSMNRCAGPVAAHPPACAPAARSLKQRDERHGPLCGGLRMRGIYDTVCCVRGRKRSSSPWTCCTWGGRSWQPTRTRLWTSSHRRRTKGSIGEPSLAKRPQRKRRWTRTLDFSSRSSGRVLPRSLPCSPPWAVACGKRSRRPLRVLAI